MRVLVYPGLSQTSNPGLKFVNAFGVPEFVFWSSA